METKNLRYFRFLGLDIFLLEKENPTKINEFISYFIIKKYYYILKRLLLIF